MYIKTEKTHYLKLEGVGLPWALCMGKYVILFPLQCTRRWIVPWGAGERAELSAFHVNSFLDHFLIN